MISVIIPTYNSEVTIERAVRSVLSQRADLDVEIIICDDASHDKTIEICKQLGVDEIIVRQDNSGGPNWGRNAGLAAMKGDRFCFLDHDDELLPGALRILSEIDAGIVFGEYYFRSGEKQIFRGIGDNRTINYEKNELFLNVLKQNKKGYCLPYLSGMLVSAEFKHVRFEEDFGFMDFDYMLRLAEHRRAVKINAPVFVRYSHGSNLSLDPNFRRVSYWFSSMTLENYYQTYPREVAIGMSRLTGTKARYHYITGENRLARFFFMRSRLCLKSILFFITSFYGSKYVKKYFKIFGT
ncbi:glycosyltransferase family 2 protein [candidate division KSB1 bacterium]|nr:glycosyltransferase family 2 protein [candidate division KSB1 bacterium]